LCRRKGKTPGCNRLSDKEEGRREGGEERQTASPSPLTVSVKPRRKKKRSFIGGVSKEGKRKRKKRKESGRCLMYLSQQTNGKARGAM